MCTRKQYPHGFAVVFFNWKRVKYGKSFKIWKYRDFSVFWNVSLFRATSTKRSEKQFCATRAQFCATLAQFCATQGCRRCQEHRLAEHWQLWRVCSAPKVPWRVCSKTESTTTPCFLPSGLDVGHAWVGQALGPDNLQKRERKPRQKLVSLQLNILNYTTMPQWCVKTRLKCCQVTSCSIFIVFFFCGVLVFFSSASVLSFHVCFFQFWAKFPWHHSFAHVARGYSEMHLFKCWL